MTTIKRTVMRTLAVIAVGLSVVLGAGSASAAPPGARAEADRVMNLSYSDFVNYKVGGSHPFPFDFSSDGCSQPTPAGLDVKFDQPCQQHDFGYRNYGRGYMLEASEQTRLWIDDRFLVEMDRLCHDQHQGFAQQGNLQVCLYQAQVIYDNVRRFGSGAFFG